MADNNKSSRILKLLLVFTLFVFACMVAAFVTLFIYAQNQKAVVFMEQRPKPQEAFFNTESEEHEAKPVEDELLLSMREAVEVDTIYNNIYIEGIDVSGLSKNEAFRKVEEEIKYSFHDDKVILWHDVEVFTYNFEEMGISRDIQSAVEKAYNYARHGDIYKRFELVNTLLSKRYTIDLQYIIDEDKINAVLDEIDKKYFINPTNPAFKRKNGGFIIEEGSPGIKINRERIKISLEKKLENKETAEIEIVFDEVKSAYDKSIFEKSQQLIGSYSTVYFGGDIPRNKNLTVAASKLNNKVIFPGEVFSTNDAFGESSAVNGYTMAPIIIGGKFVEGMGGGICQVSSTLYNALLYAELKIVQRQNHSLKVGYTDYGFDATLSNNVIDLKFENDTEYPVLLESYLTENKVVVNIYGYEVHSPGRSLKFEKELIETFPPGPETIIEDPALPMGEIVVEKAAKTGYSFKIYKLVYDENTFIEKVHVNTSVYKMINGEVRLGTAPIPDPEPDGPAALPE